MSTLTIPTTNSTLRRDLGLVGRQIGYEQRTYWRNRGRGVFTFAFPLMFLVIFASLDKSGHISSLGGIPYDDFLVPGILAYGVIMTTFTNMSMTTTILRDAGVLKRMQGTPLPRWAYTAARIGSTCLVTATLAVVTIVGGILVWGVNLPVGALPGLVVTLLLGTAAFTTIGIGMAQFIPKAETGAVIINLIVLPISFISNIWYPTAGMPAALRTIADIFPINALARGLQYAFDPRNHGPGFDWTHLWTLAIWTVIGIFLMLRFLRKPQGEQVSKPLAQDASPGSPSPSPSPSPSSSRTARVGLPKWHEDRPSSPVRPIMAGVWLVFILVPIADALGRGGQRPATHWLVVAGALSFSVAYVAVIMVMFNGSRWLELALCGALVVLATALTIGDQNSWAYLFCYCAACAAMVLPSTPGFAAVIGCAGLAVGATALAGGSLGSGLGFAASVIGVGFLLMLLRDLRIRNQELADARAELAHAAVAAERERFARDLHDLLGHSLSVIAIKAELAGRLLPGSPERAAVEVGEVEGVARQALSEVRQAVSGYRQPTLAGELEGARVALSAAGIDASIDREPVSLDPEVEAVLAWTVREGATNVIRHSGASHCSVTVRAQAGDAGVEVLDDGVGNGRSPGFVDTAVGGNGLTGLRERAATLRGRIEAGTAPGGGYRLAVSVPVSSGTTGGDGR